MSLLLSLRLSESTKCRSNLQLALLAIAVLSNQVVWKKCALVFALNGLSNWMLISGAKGHDFKHKKHNIFRDVICFLLFSYIYFFSTRQHSYFGVTHCENSEVQIAVFSKWNMLRELKLVQRIIFCLSSTLCR